jgi:hypothetical protein
MGAVGPDPNAGARAKSSSSCDKHIAVGFNQKLTRQAANHCNGYAAPGMRTHCKKIGLKRYNGITDNKKGLP